MNHENFCKERQYDPPKKLVIQHVIKQACIALGVPVLFFMFLSDVFNVLILLLLSMCFAAVYYAHLYYVANTIPRWQGYRHRVVRAAYINLRLLPFLWMALVIGFFATF